MDATDFDRLCGWPGLPPLIELAWNLFRVNLAVVAPDGERSFCDRSERREGAFCRALHQLAGGRRLCTECDRRFFHQAREQARLLRYRCHAGLTEFIVPIVRDGQVIALLQCGQVRDAQIPDPASTLSASIPLIHPAIDPAQLNKLYLRNRILPPKRQQDLMLFLQMAADHLAQSELSGTPEPARRNQDAFRRIVRFIEANLAEDLSLAVIARSCAVSRRTLSRLFRAEAGATVLHFVMRRRIARACHYLATSDLSCIEIAFAVGFQSVQNFNRTFRRLKGGTPRSWRLAHLRRAIQPPSSSEISPVAASVHCEAQSV